MSEYYLTNEQKELIEKYKDYLVLNDIEGFLRALSKVLFPSDILSYHTILDFLAEHGLDVYSESIDVELDALAKIKEIPSRYFSNNYVKENMKIPEGIKYIDDEAFENSISLKSIELPSTLKAIYYKAFEGCTSLSSIIIPEGVKTIGDEAFVDCTSLETVTLPSTLKFIGEWAFYNCTSLKEIKIPKALNPEVYEEEFLEEEVDDKIIII